MRPPVRRRGAARAPVLALLLLALPGAGPAAGGGSRVAGDGAGEAVRFAHDLHIAYADLAIEGNLVAGRIRMFKDDLERALGGMVDADAVALRPGSEADALVMGYVRDRLRIRTAGAGRTGPALAPTLLQSGQDELDREPVWWVIVQYEATAPIDALRVRNTLLFDVFDDQRNIMKFVRFPEQRQKTFYFDADETEHLVGW